jgi:hypothetical protein
MKVVSPLFAVAIAAAVFAPRVDAVCDPVCVADDIGCAEAKVIAAGATLEISAPEDKDCTLGKFLNLNIGGQATDSIAVTFSDGITATSTDSKDVATTTVCKSTFKDVGKDVVVLTNVPKSVVATVKCNNPTADCKVTYLPTWTCQTRSDKLCPKECSDTVNCKASTIAISGSLILTNPDTCPASKYSYLTSLMVGSRDKSGIAVAFAATGATTTPATTDTSGTCYSVYGQYPVAAQLAAQAGDASATVTCAPNTAACTVQAYATWGCDAPKCSTVCGAGCTDAVIATGGNLMLTKPATTCPVGTFAYPKGLKIGGKYAAHNLAVSFNNNFAPKPTAPVADCYFSYPDLGTSALTADVEVKVQCKDATKPCTAQYKVDSWECQAKTYTRTAMVGANCKAANDCVNRCGKSYKVNAKGTAGSFVPQLAADCKCTALTATMAADGKTATNADMTATFDATANTLVLDVTTTGAVCKSTYAVNTFTNPFIPRSYIRQSMAPAACVKADDNTYKCDGDVVLTQPATDKITLTQTTPGAGAITCSGTIDAFLSDDAKTAADATTKIVYTPTATGMQVVTTNADASTCTAVYAGRCAKPCVGCTDQAIASGGSFVVKKADDKTCPTGQFAYPKTLLVGGKDLSQVAVTFNNGLKPTPIDSSGDCFFSYGDVVGSSAVTSNVEATVKCKDPAVACTAQVKVGDWGCYGPPDAAKTYTRTAMTGANCVAKLSDCANRCGKSYALGVKDTFTTYVPQLAPDCKCPQFTATPAADAKSAANADAGLTVTYDTTASTMSLAFAKTGAVCTSTYKLAAFTNPFPVKTFTRQNVTPADCVAATDCGYRCDAEIALNKTQVDTVAAVRTAVPSCTCKTTITYVGDDRKATGADDTATYLLEATDAGVSVSTTIGAKTCVAAYTEKIVTPAPTTPAPVTTTPAPTAKTGTGTSAGVSALGAGAGAGVTTVTLVAAAAGVQAIGLPV